MPGSARVVKAMACPLRREIRTTQIPKLIDELQGVGLVVRYERGGEQVLHFPGFPRQQIGLRKEREAPSKFGPPKPEEVRSKSGPTPEYSGPDPAEGHLREVKRSLNLAFGFPVVPDHGARGQEEKPNQRQDEKSKQAEKPKTLKGDLTPRQLFPFLDGPELEERVKEVMGSDLSAEFDGHMPREVALAHFRKPADWWYRLASDWHANRFWSKPPDERKKILLAIFKP